MKLSRNINSYISYIFISICGCTEVNDGKNILILSDSAIVVFDAANGNYLDWIPLKRIAISFCKFAENVEGEYFFWSYSKNSIYVKDGENMYPIKKRSGYPLACYSFYLMYR